MEHNLTTFPDYDEDDDDDDVEETFDSFEEFLDHLLELENEVNHSLSEDDFDEMYAFDEDEFDEFIEETEEAISIVAGIGIFATFLAVTVGAIILCCACCCPGCCLKEKVQRAPPVNDEFRFGQRGANGPDRREPLLG